MEASGITWASIAQRGQQFAYWLLPASSDNDWAQKNVLKIKQKPQRKSLEPVCSINTQTHSQKTSRLGCLSSQGIITKKKFHLFRTGRRASSTNRFVVGMERGMLATGCRSFNLFIINLHLAMALVSSGNRLSLPAPFAGHALLPTAYFCWSWVKYFNFLALQMCLNISAYVIRSGFWFNTSVTCHSAVSFRILCDF